MAVAVATLCYTKSAIKLYLTVKLIFHFFRFYVLLILVFSSSCHGSDDFKRLWSS